MSQQTARYLRKHQTDAERKLWRELRNLKREGFHFRRQAPMGRYVADFACHSAKLIIEVDGGQHNEDEGLEADTHRTAWLETQGYRVFRFWNSDVLLNIDGVQQALRVALGLDGAPHPIRFADRPPHEGELSKAG